MYEIESTYKGLDGAKVQDAREHVVNTLTELDVPPHRIRVMEYQDQLDFHVKFTNNSWIKVASAFSV